MMSLPSTFAVSGKDLKLMDVRITDLKEEFLKIVLDTNHQEEVRENVKDFYQTKWCNLIQTKNSSTLIETTSFF